MGNERFLPAVFIHKQVNIFQGSSSSGIGVYESGYGAALTTQMKLWHLKEKRFCPAQARCLPCCQMLVNSLDGKVSVLQIHVLR